jgi:hypothetical protein
MTSMAKKRGKQTLSAPDRSVSLRQRNVVTNDDTPPLFRRRSLQRISGPEASVYVAVTYQVVTRAATWEQEEKEEASRITCLDFGAERHNTYKGTGANFCDTCDKCESLEPHKKTDKRRHTKTYWCTVKGHAVNYPSKTNKGWLNYHYSLEMNINEERVIQSLVPPNILEDQQPTASTAHTALNVPLPQTPDELNPPPASNKTETPSPSTNSHVHTPEDSNVSHIEHTTSASSRRSSHSITNNERNIGQHKLQILLRAKENDKLRNEINVLRNKLLNEQKMKSKYKREIDRLTGNIINT